MKHFGGDNGHCSPLSLQLIVQHIPNNEAQKCAYIKLEVRNALLFSLNKLFKLGYKPILSDWRQIEIWNFFFFHNFDVKIVNDITARRLYSPSYCKKKELQQLLQL